ncbi:MAG: class I SAM-dependent methyltransferase [Candidatus Hodarchaeota archaeon]
MKVIGNLEYYSVAEIFENVFHKRIKQEEILEYFETGKLKGEKIEKEWYANEGAINDFVKNIYLKEKAFNVGLHKLDLSNVVLKGKILDIGGGGEGIIGQLKGENVIAIDPNRKELEESPSKDDLKIVMDAKDLKFLDNTFDTATSFFTLMYIPREDHRTVFQEIYRVLKKDGEYVVWDAIIPNRGTDNRSMFFISLEVNIGDKKVETGYGVSWNKELNMKYISDLAGKIGFKLLEKRDEKNTFYLRFRKR